MDEYYGSVKGAIGDTYIYIYVCSYVLFIHLFMYLFTCSFTQDVYVYTYLSTRI